jgi:hypothetical protein
LNFDDLPVEKESPEVHPNLNQHPQPTMKWPGSFKVPIAAEKLVKMSNKDVPPLVGRQANLPSAPILLVQILLAPVPLRKERRK